MVGGTLLGVLFVEPYNQKMEQYFIEKHANAFNETYRGTVIDIQYPEGQPKPALEQSIVKIELDYSTTKHYDLRNTISYYDCVIDYPDAEIIIGHMLNIGDSIIYDGIYDVYWVKVEGYGWYNFKPNVSNINNGYVKQFITIPKYTKKQLEIRKKSYPKPLELPNNYFMLLFGRFKNKQNLSLALKKMSNQRKLEIEKRKEGYYWFYDKERYGTYKEVFTAWKKSGCNKLYIAKFDKHNNFIEVLKKTKKKND